MAFLSRMKKGTITWQQKTKAFTLIESFVVIAIVALALAMLLSVVQGVRAHKAALRPEAEQAVKPFERFTVERQPGRLGSPDLFLIHDNVDFSDVLFIQGYSSAGAVVLPRRQPPSQRIITVTNGTSGTIQVEMPHE